MGSRRKAAAIDVEAVRAPFLAEGRRRTRSGWMAASLVGFLALAGGLVVGAAANAPGVLGGGLVVTVLAILVGAMAHGQAMATARLRAARALLDAEAFEAAVLDLKELSREGSDVRDEALYHVALAYDRQGAARLALESYRRYHELYAKGHWSVEARVRIEELEQAARAASVDVKARGLLDEDCPFCKASIGDELSVECGACGTRHHMACYQEQGGCSVYGCASKAARVPVKD